MTQPPDHPDRVSEPTTTLVQLAVGGSPEAVEALCGRYLPRLRRWAEGRLPARARGLLETQDLVQEVLLSSIQRLPEIRNTEGSGFLFYVRKALENRIRNAIRDASRRPVGEGLTEDIPDPGLTPIEASIGEEAVARFNEALGKLAEDERELVIARVEMGMSWREIAIAHGKPSADAARMAASRALDKLVHLIAAEVPGR
jgi:RNA polymerase sigma-70 factor (ECF subfamily)